MAKSDRPGGEGPERAPLRVYRGGRARGTRPQPASPREVARRLSALERRVEKALGPLLGVEPAPDRLGRLADSVLGALAGARRLSRRDFQTAVANVSSVVEELGQDVTATTLDVLYRYWWRVEAVGFERIPAAGRVIVVTNRGGALLPYEPLMIRVALAQAAARRAAVAVDDWLVRLPLLGGALATAGAMRDTPAAVRRVLAEDGAVIASPEVGQPKTFRQRYRLAPFGRGRFARLAIETGAPIVPVAVIGAEEIHPVLARLDLAGRLLGLPTVPITPTFPWLGLAGLVPFPTKWLLLAGEPLDVAARHPPATAADARVVARLRDQVRERLQALVLEGLRRRRSVFRG